jgi:predicted RNA binding protein YcfA (HicA-like mRNA interferase family)
MSRSPRVTGAELVSALARIGFAIARIRGSHNFLRHEDGCATVVPIHSGEIIGPGLLNKILARLQVEAGGFGWPASTLRS